MATYIYSEKIKINKNSKKEFEKIDRARWEFVSGSCFRAMKNAMLIADQLNELLVIKTLQALFLQTVGATGLYEQPIAVSGLNENENWRKKGSTGNWMKQLTTRKTAGKLPDNGRKVTGIVVRKKSKTRQIKKLKLAASKLHFLKQKQMITNLKYCVPMCALFCILTPLAKKSLSLFSQSLSTLAFLPFGICPLGQWVFLFLISEYFRYCDKVLKLWVF